MLFQLVGHTNFFATMPIVSLKNKWHCLRSHFVRNFSYYGPRIRYQEI